MPDEKLLSVQTVRLNISIERIISRPGKKAICDVCGEEIMNEREIIRDVAALCRSCAGSSYYSFVADFCATPVSLPKHAKID